ncbi:hypothetical protein [Streptomyces fumanus]|uniref:Uncharacterized protein n=1 Tax=Streptomyces fumanus TaxID=67302 RepID=A0A919ATQ4_9ACTN|nr:hypothetical protein [Streptomyces fumanus]GHF23769.1 hypothetical protein GCM10018772_56780 [Streptomyces fumanus]
MADDEKTVVQPDQMVRGGELTDQVSRRARELADAFVEATRQDPAHPVWGGDAYGKTFAKDYEESHRQLAEAVVHLADAVSAAAAMTISSGTSFAAAQSTAVERIQDGAA